MKAIWNGAVIAESDDTVVVEGNQNVDAAWTYADPKPAASEIKGRIAFWRGVQVAD